MAELLPVLDDTGCDNGSLPPTLMEARTLSVRTNRRPLVRNVDLQIPENQVFSLIGPSGAGKSTVLRCLNRLIDLTPRLKVSGEILLHGQSIFNGNLAVDQLRQRVGMLFQQPAVFPKSIYENVIFGVRRVLDIPRREWPDLVEHVLREVSLWQEVKDRLKDSATGLSIGQQQRLCLARTLAVKPEIILMDEPTSSLDPRSTEAIEELILRLKEHHTIVLVSHDLSQVRRVADYVACVCVSEGAGKVVESACCDAMLSNPQCQETIEFLDAAHLGWDP